MYFNRKTFLLCLLGWWEFLFHMMPQNENHEPKEIIYLHFYEENVFS